MKLFAMFFLMVCLVSCASDVNRKSAVIHAQAAQNAIENNDWDAARKSWSKAVVNSELAHEPDQKMAVFYYEYGRALGVTCFYDESEVYLKKAYELDKKTNGPVYMSLTELARLNLDQDKYSKSLLYFEELIPLLDKINAKSEAPLEYSNILEDYSKSLLNTKQIEKSKSIMQDVEEIRKMNQNRYSITERTLYGSQCIK